MKHEDIFKKEDLPTYNSNAIEANLCNISELSDIFIYFNDDFFLGNNIYYDDIFTLDNKIKLYQEKKYNQNILNCDVKNQKNGYYAALCNSNTLLNKKFTFSKNRLLPHHQMKIFSKEILSRLYELFPYEMRLTTSNSFRSYNDLYIALVHNTVAEIYNIGKPVVSTNQKLVNLNKPFKDWNLMHIKKKKFFCLNNATNKDFNRITKFLEKKFPKPSKFEKIPTVIISFTTLPSRIDKLEPLLIDLSQQTHPPNKIIINIPSKSIRENKKYKIPGFFKKYKKVSVNYCKKDWGPATKFIPTILKYKKDPDLIIIVIDDDTEYPNNLIANYLKYEKRLPNNALCLRGRDTTQSTL